MKGDDQQCLAAGMDAYLSKPFRIEDLRSVIDAVLPSTAPDSMHTCDWNAAVEALDGEEEFLREIASLFIEDSPQWMREIRESIEQRDAHRLQSAAHRLKGSLLAFRATAATESAEQLEVMGRKGTLTSAKNVSRQLEQRMDDLLKDLEQKLAESVHADAGGPA
jgi:HPt (histidine-containing phosphotransfer) domain-containing protein